MNATLIHTYLLEAGVKGFDGVTGDGQITWGPEATDADKSAAAGILAGLASREKADAIRAEARRKCESIFPPDEQTARLAEFCDLLYLATLGPGLDAQGIARVAFLRAQWGRVRAIQSFAVRKISGEEAGDDWPE